MILTKTERGRALLSDRRALSPRERQLLVLADGRRSTAELGRLLGFEVEPAVQRLLQEGYLERARSAAGQPEVAAGAMASGPVLTDRPQTRAIEALTAEAPVAPPAPEAAPASPPRGGSRRSLAASKMYVVSLMQMLRDADAASIAVSLHCAEGADDLVEAFTGALVYLHNRSGADYASRVASRLMEVMPLAQLPQLCEALDASGAGALKAVAEAQRQVDKRMAVPPVGRPAASPTAASPA